LYTELKYFDHRVSDISTNKLKEIEIFCGESSKQNLCKNLECFFANVNLDTAPKLYLITHLIIKIIDFEKRDYIRKNLNVGTTTYIPQIKQGMSEKKYCDFLMGYAKYLEYILSFSEFYFQIFNESIDIQMFIRESVLKDGQLGILTKSLVQIKHLTKVG